jgi:hypothetical protein
MPPKKSRKVKKPRLGRAARAGRTAADKKNSQKLKQTQRVTVNITSGGGGGGSTAPALPFYKPEPFVYTKRQNLEDINLLNMIKKAAANSNMVSGNILGKADPAVVNPANDATTTTAVFNAPINNTDNLAEEVLREINQMGIKPKPIAKPPVVFNVPNTNNLSLAERVRPPPQTGDVSEYGGETDTGSARKRKPRKDKGLTRGSTKEKYRQVGFEEGIPAGRNIQNEFVMGVEQMQGRAIKPGQMRLVPTEETMENAPAQSTSSADLNFA